MEKNRYTIDSPKPSCQLEINLNPERGKSVPLTTYTGQKEFLVFIFLALVIFLSGTGRAEDEAAPPGAPAQRPTVDRAWIMRQRVEMLKKKQEARARETQPGDAAKEAPGGGPEDIYHVVRPGEDAARVASQYNISKEVLFRLNDLEAGHVLRPGERLLVKKADRAESPRIKGGSFTMNFQDVDIRTLIRFISEITGKNFLVEPDVQGNVTILSPGKVTVDEAYQVFLSVLEVHGYTAVPSGNVIKIISAAEAPARGIETLTQVRKLPAEDKMVTQLVPLKHGLAADFAKFIRPLVAKTGILIPYPDTNTLIITDVQSNIDRLVKIIEELDIPGEKEKITIVALKNADAGKLAGQLTQLFQPKKGRRAVEEVVKIIADDRTNSLIIVASAELTEDIERMLKELDREILRRRGNIHVYQLQNAVAEDVAKVLGELPGKGEEKKEGKAAPAPPPISKDVHIIPDKATNTLVIIAEPDEFKILEDIIEKLDVARTLVYVEALILEVSASKALDLGVEWRVGDEYSGGLQAGTSGGVFSVGSRASNAQTHLTDIAQGGVPPGFAVGVVGRAITLGGVTFPSIAAFARAVRTDSDFNVISTPQILTLDNEEATIEVGQNIPYVTSVVQQAAVTDRPIQNFEYRDIGVTLKVTPHVHKHRTVRLEVEQSIKNVLDTSAGSDLLAPTTTYRNTKSTITVGDGETAVIGGLVETQQNRGKTMTPCLGGVPGLGWAFKQISDKDDRRNLMVFLTPHTIETPEERRALSGDKREYMNKEIEKSILRNQPEELRRKAFE